MEITHLLFGKKKRVAQQTVRLETTHDASDIYYIKEAVLSNVTLPTQFEPPVRVRKIKSRPDQPDDVYRVTIFGRWHESRVITRHGENYVLKPGLYAWRQYLVTVAGPGEYVFTPPLAAD